MALILNGEYVGDELFFEELRHLGGTAVDPPDSEGYLRIEVLQREAERRVLHRILFRQMALREDYRISDEELQAERLRCWPDAGNRICGAEVVEALRVNILVRHLRGKLTKHVPRPTRLEVERFYRTHLERFHQPERILASHIIRNVDRLDNEPQARAILEVAETELASGKPFAKVADLYSDCRGMGGSLGWIARGEMVDEFDDIVFPLKKGERSPIFRTVFGLHIATVLGRKSAGTQPLEEIRHPIALSLLEGRREKAIEDILTDAMSRSQITVVPAGDRDSARAKEVAH